MKAYLNVCHKTYNDSNKHYDKRRKRLHRCNWIRFTLHNVFCHRFGHSMDLRQYFLQLRWSVGTRSDNKPRMKTLSLSQNDIIIVEILRCLILLWYLCSKHHSSNLTQNRMGIDSDICQRWHRLVINERCLHWHWNLVSDHQPIRDSATHLVTEILNTLNRFIFCP